MRSPPNHSDHSNIRCMYLQEIIFPCKFFMVLPQKSDLEGDLCSLDSHSNCFQLIPNPQLDVKEQSIVSGRRFVHDGVYIVGHAKRMQRVSHVVHTTVIFTIKCREIPRVHNSKTNYSQVWFVCPVRPRGIF